MAYENRGTNLPGIVAGADLSSAQHRFLKIDSNGKAVLCGAGEAMCGVNEGTPVADQPVPIQGPGSVVKVEASAAIANGDLVASDATGQAAVAGAGNFVAGYCVEAAGAAGELCSVHLSMNGKA